VSRILTFYVTFSDRNVNNSEILQPNWASDSATSTSR